MKQIKVPVLYYRLWVHRKWLMQCLILWQYAQYIDYYIEEYEFPNFMICFLSLYVQCVEKSWCPIFHCKYIVYSSFITEWKFLKLQYVLISLYIAPYFEIIRIKNFSNIFQYRWKMPKFSCFVYNGLEPRFWYLRLKY